jgi:hypothetical protein
MSLSFKMSNGDTFSIPEYSDTGAKRAKSATESDQKKDKWYKLNEEAMVEGAIGSIVDINAKIDSLTKKLKSQKSLLNSLKSAASAAMKVDGMASYLSAHIAAIENEVDIINDEIEFLRQLETYLAFSSQDNMYFKC